MTLKDWNFKCMEPYKKLMEPPGRMEAVAQY